MQGRYFDMNKKNCREAFDIYKQFITRVDKVDQFFKIAEVFEWFCQAGVNIKKFPISTIPASLIIFPLINPNDVQSKTW